MKTTMKNIKKEEAEHLIIYMNLNLVTINLKNFFSQITFKMLLNLKTILNEIKTIILMIIQEKMKSYIKEKITIIIIVMK